MNCTLRESEYQVVIKMENANAMCVKAVRFDRFVYQADPSDANCFAVGSFVPKTPLLTVDGHRISRFSVVGYALPHCTTLEYDLYGEWTRSKKYGTQFELQTYKEIVPDTKEGIIAYLSSGQIKGIGKSIANQIYDLFGADTLRILDNDPDQLLAVRGISSRKLEKIKNSYMESRGARNIISYLLPRGVPVGRCVRIYKKYQQDAMNIVTKHPYQLIEMPGIGFTLADSIALNSGLPAASEERVSAGIMQALKDAETSGNLCISKQKLIDDALTLLTTGKAQSLLSAANCPVESVLNQTIVAAMAGRLRSRGRLVTKNAMCYRPKVAQAESDIASFVTERIMLMMDGTIQHSYKLDDVLNAEEEKLGYQLDAQQRAAVGMALSMYLSCITGGPGTGKTTIEKAILDIYASQYPRKKICCCAPTGRAARRMAESTGYPASTIHSLLQIVPEDELPDDTEYTAPTLDADLVIVDEFSMVDVWVARALFAALKPKAQLVIIGDADQLPSVGPGAILSELLSCSNYIPIVRLDTVHRQADGSIIAENAAKIRAGKSSLLYADDFQLVQSSDMEESAKICCDLYMAAVKQHGLEQVCMLSPFRKRGTTATDHLNPILRDRCNPPSPDKPELTVGSTTFRVGDRVMQLKNDGDLANGDCGYITAIGKDSDDELVVTVDYGDDRVRDLDRASLLGSITLAYAMTIHKSQGSEYKTVILNLQQSQHIMLKRPLIYTGITRAKENVIIVGEEEAVKKSIHRLDTQKRGTMLAERIDEAVQGRIRRERAAEICD